MLTTENWQLFSLSKRYLDLSSTDTIYIKNYNKLRLYAVFCEMLRKYFVNNLVKA